MALSPATPVVASADVIVTGGGSQSAVSWAAIIAGAVAAAACLVNRSGGQLPAMDFPFHGLVELNPETFAPDALPPDLAGIPAIKPGSK